ncbi:hypothetical protein [uncultured Caulobacter sp.]|uniref:hypothetical protein n=1 Tax=uncultured Caulobacter sp. TaxID=158749 RepID=UPI002607DE8C|nr:hypothetical protein [uncultured Caulobacter sp.]
MIARGLVPGLIASATLAVATPVFAAGCALDDLGMRARLLARVNRYDTARFNTSVLELRTPLASGEGALRGDGFAWRVTCEGKPVPGRPSAREVAVSFKLVEGAMPAGSVSLDLDVEGWSAANYVLGPAALYNGNRFPWRRLRYSPKLAEVQDFGPDSPTVITDVPRLSLEGPSRVQLRSGALATPALGYFAPGAGQAVLLSTGQKNALGDQGVSIEETANRDVARFSLTAPVVRERVLYRFMDSERFMNSQTGSWDRPHDFKAGETIVLKLTLDAWSATSPQALYDRLLDQRDDRDDGAVAVGGIALSEANRILIDKQNRENWVERSGYYSVGLRENFLQDWQIGWTGGMIATYPLLAAGDAATRARVARNFDWLFASGISPSGFFYDAGKDGTVWYGGDVRKPQSRNWHLIRKSGDALWMILRQFELMRRLGVPVKPAWRDGTRGVADAFVRLWEREGQLGQFVDSETGKVAVGGSASGAPAVSGLVLAARYYHEPRYLAVAEQIADRYARDFTDKGLSTGGPGDALQNPDSESSWALLEGYVSLYQATGAAKWLELARRQAAQYASWVVSYDFAFPEGSAFAKAGIRSKGAVYANTQNTHAAPGICTRSGLALLELYRVTGDRRYLDLLGATTRNITQYVPHPLRPLGDMPVGHVSERVNLTDWEGPDTIGYILPLTTWAEISVMLTAVELPSVYVDLARDRLFVLDNVKAELVPTGRGRQAVRLTNLTKTAADYVIYAERPGEGHAPLAEGYLRGAPHVTLRPGETRTIPIPAAPAGRATSSSAKGKLDA